MIGSRYTSTPSLSPFISPALAASCTQRHHWAQCSHDTSQCMQCPRYWSWVLSQCLCFFCCVLFCCFVFVVSLLTIRPFFHIKPFFFYNYKCAGWHRLALSSWQQLHMAGTPVAKVNTDMSEVAETSFCSSWWCQLKNWVKLRQRLCDSKTGYRFRFRIRFNIDSVRDIWVKITNCCEP